MVPRREVFWSRDSNYKDRIYIVLQSLLYIVDRTLFSARALRDIL